MGLITKTVMVKWNSKTKRHYEDLGYLYTKIGDEFEVKIEDLTKGSNVKVNCKCDGCGKDLTWSYNDYNNQVREHGETYCSICAKNLYKTGEPFFKTFYDWCVDNERQDVLGRWDYDLNKCSPKDISFSTSKKYYFKCDRHPEHHSELKNICNFINGHEGCIACKQCNSIAQYIVDNFPNKDLYDVWDKDKNGEANPWNISRGSRSKKYWFICQEKDYHGSYEATCDKFSSGRRCSYCANMKVHKKDSLGQYIIDNYGVDFLHKVWSDKNDISAFEISPNSAKKVWWKCPEGEHEDYLRLCNRSFTYEFRCPKCVEEMTCSIIEGKTKSYLKEIGFSVLTEHNCTIRPFNPKTNNPMPYDNEIVLNNGKHLIIEVHGEQHYKPHFYMTRIKCSEEANKLLRYQQVKDRYKKAYAEHCGYEYLEIPYTAFDKKETYKQMIDDKIEEILHNTKAS